MNDDARRSADVINAIRGFRDQLMRAGVAGTTQLVMPAGCFAGLRYPQRMSYLSDSVEGEVLLSESDGAAPSHPKDGEL